MNFKIIRLLQLGLFFVFATGSFGQKPLHIIEAEIHEALVSKLKFPAYTLVSPMGLTQNISNTVMGAENVSVMTLNSKVVHQLFLDKPRYALIPLKDPFNNEMNLLLEQQQIHGSDSRLITSDDAVGQALSDGLYFRGVIQGIPGSFAAISVFPNEIIGVLSTPVNGNIVLGKLQLSTNQTENETQHILYYEKDLLEKNPFHCGTEAISEIEQFLEPEGLNTLFTNRCKTTKIYLECDYKLFTDHNRNVVQTETFIKGLFNVVKALYYRDSINIEISNVFVWTTQDPFLHTDLQSILINYTNYRKDNFTGNLAQLVTTFAPQQQGGIAWLSTLCQPYNGFSGPHSFAYVYLNYSQLPTYSWSVMVMAHELGHNFGSPHTHACSWGPNKNAALDNCYATEGGCLPGPALPDGGTIMSYCHLGGTGINLSKGFGPEPGALIRSRVNSGNCIALSFVAQMTVNNAGPYLEGDNIILKAKPALSSYTYDWFHYDYRIPTAKDSNLTINYNGIYKAAISNRCTEYTPLDTIEIQDFLVNLGCPILPGKRDSFEVELIMNADQSTMRDSLEFPDSLYAKIPLAARDVLIELQEIIEPKGTSWTRDVQISYSSPPEIEISKTKYTPNSVEPPLFKEKRWYRKILGNFNPKGKWYFSTLDNRIDVGIDATVTIKIVLSWRMKDTVSRCEIPLCPKKSLLLDAGIPNATYNWSNGLKTKTVTVNKTGPITVTVSRNGKSSSHTVNVISKPIHFHQDLSICEGDSLWVGNSYYHETGVYIDSLLAVDGCDSILTSTLTVLKKSYSSEELNFCYGDFFNNILQLTDTVLNYQLIASNGCDSIHTIHIHVNPEIVLQTNTIPACENIGGELEIIANGGTQPFVYKWSSGEVNNKIEKKSSGIYTISIIDSEGCLVTTQVELQNFDSIRVKEEILEILCYGDENGEIILHMESGTTPFNFSWSNGKSTQDISGLSEGKYNVFIRDMNGCLFVKEYELINPEFLFVSVDIKASSGNDGTAKVNVAGGSPPFQYLWSNGAVTEEIINLSPGTYTVTVTDNNQCKSENVVQVDMKVATQNDYPLHHIILYPNPTTGNSTLINNSTIAIHKISILTILGETIQQINVQNDLPILLPLECEPNGLFVVWVYFLNGSKLGMKLVKQ